MNMEALIEKYISSAEKVFKDLQKTNEPTTVTKENVVTILSWAADYLTDAKYYKAKGNLETSLTSVAYCEGLLDALRLLGVVKFEWPMNQRRTKLS